MIHIFVKRTAAKAGGFGKLSIKVHSNSVKSFDNVTT